MGGFQRHPEEMMGPLFLQIPLQRLLPVSLIQKVSLACGVQMTFQRWGVCGQSPKGRPDMRIPVQVIYQEGEAVGKTEGKVKKACKSKYVTSGDVLCGIASAGSGRGPLGR